MSFVVLLDSGVELNDPTWEVVKGILEEMDGARRSITSLNHFSGLVLMIAGGNGGRFVVSCVTNVETQESLTLTDPDAGELPVEISVEGVAADYPRCKTVRKSQVLDVCEQFFRTGSVPVGFSWAVEF